MQKASYLSVFFYHIPARYRWRAFQDMGLQRFAMEADRAVDFHRFLGTGHGLGFSIRPNFSVYAFLTAWKDRESAEQQMDGIHTVPRWSEYAEKTDFLLAECTQVHGLWASENPFEPNKTVSEEDAVVVLTRATIKKRRLHRFWKYVPLSSQTLATAEGCLFSKGVGEWPFVQAATLSIWESTSAMKAFAYQSEHAKIIQLARTEGWYSEELFARFRLLKTSLIDPAKVNL